MTKAKGIAMLQFIKQECDKAGDIDKCIQIISEVKESLERRLAEEFATKFLN